MDEIKRINGALVIGDGEVTGHQHLIREPSAKMRRVNADVRALQLPKASTLSHEKGGVPAEHRDIVLPIGEPCVTVKRQYTPDGWENVQD
jgi:hypothetical protein